MKRFGAWWMACVLLAGAAACTPPADEGAAEEQAPQPMTAEEATQDMIDRFDTAITAGDVDAMLALFTADGSTSPPGAPTASGTEKMRAYFAGLFTDGGIAATNTLGDVRADGDLIVSRGTYTITADGEIAERGSWSSIGRRVPDGSNSIVHNIWNRDAPAPGQPAPPPLAESGPAPAADAVCAGSPKEIDQAFAKAVAAGDVAGLVALHHADAVRMPPDMPAVQGHADIARFIRSRVEPFKTRVLDLSDIREGTSGDLGWTMGQYRLEYTPKKKGPAMKGAGTYMAISSKGDDGCWRNLWAIWNSDAPPPAA